MVLRHPQADRGHDLYETPECATTALLDVEWLPHTLWEPACGRGAIVRVLRARGHEVLSTDLIDYASPDQDFGETNFLAESLPWAGVDAIVTNPPFSLAAPFIRHAISLVPKVCMLLRLAFLEGSSRSDILDGGQLARVHIFRNRLMHRDGWEGPRNTNTTAFAWFVFDRSHRGAATINRITWKKDSV